MRLSLCKALALLLIGIAAQAAAAADRPEGPNCDLTEPPQGAGEFVAGNTADDMLWSQVYPHASAIGDDYGGCQAQWFWTLARPNKMLGLVVFKDGRAIGYWPEDKAEPWCRRGEDSSETGCSLFARRLLPSYPAGCYERGAVQRKLPQDCVDDWIVEYDLIKARVEAARLENIAAGAVASSQAAPDPSFPALKLHWAGSYQVKSRSKVAVPEALGSAMFVTDGKYDVVETTRIPNAIGTSFGIAFSFPELKEGEQAEFRIRWTFPMPGLVDPAVGKAAISQERNMACGRDECAVGWHIAQPWEQVPGTWTVEVLGNGKTLLSRSFDLY
jgi:hypothetical protein